MSSALLALVAYTVLAALYGSLWHASLYSYYNYLADAFLHGQFHLRLIPSSAHDLSLFNGRYYLYWPPLPAILLMPFVALFGVQFNDTYVTLGIATFNVYLIAILLRQASRQRMIRLTRLQRGLLVSFFALGTVHVTLAPYGRVWFVGQLIGFSCVALAYLSALCLKGKAAFALVGVSLAGALMTRNHLVFAGLWPVCHLLHRQKAEGGKCLLIYSLIALLPILLAVGILGSYNWARFNKVLESGFAHHQMAQQFLSEFQRYGTFSLHYLPRNLFYQFLAYPFPLGSDTLQGGSLFLLSPVFFAVFWGLGQGRPRWSAWTLLGTVFVVAVPIFLLMGTGWIQFGPRYTLDYTVPLLLLTAHGVRCWSLRLLALFTAISIVQYLIGAMYLGRMIS